MSGKNMAAEHRAHHAAKTFVPLTREEIVSFRAALCPVDGHEGRWTDRDIGRLLATIDSTEGNMGIEVRRLHQRVKDLEVVAEGQQRLMGLAASRMEWAQKERDEAIRLHAETIANMNELERRGMGGWRQEAAELLQANYDLKDDVERLKARVAELIKVGTGEVEHDYLGFCPNETVTDFDARAEGCEACRILGPAEGGR